MIIRGKLKLVDNERKDLFNEILNKLKGDLSDFQISSNKDAQTISIVEVTETGEDWDVPEGDVYIKIDFNNKSIDIETDRYRKENFSWDEIMAGTSSSAYDILYELEDDYNFTVNSW